MARGVLPSDPPEIVAAPGAVVPLYQALTPGWTWLPEPLTHSLKIAVFEVPSVIDARVTGPPIPVLPS
jgi:hypothetical protein